MALHKNLTGADIHETKVAGLAGSPVTLSTVASAANILAADVSTPSSPVLYVAKSTAAGDWGRVAGGGGGGGGFQWAAGTSKPAPSIESEYDQQVYKFTVDDVGNQSLYGVIKVPASYVAGNQIKMKLEIYSPSAANTILMQSVATLIQTGTDAVDDTTDQRTSTNSALTNTVAKQSRECVLDLTSSTGEINSVAVAAGDIIKVELKRGTDTDTADIRVRAFSVDVTYS